MYVHKIYFYLKKKTFQIIESLCFKGLHMVSHMSMSGSGGYTLTGSGVVWAMSSEGIMLDKLNF